MAEETIQILRIETGEAVTSVKELRENVKILKERLAELPIGTTEYQEALEELKVNQNAVKDAMYATSASMDDVAKSATGTSETYNGLVHRMAALKEELRATDVSTESGKARFKELASAVNETNDKLKEMDALQGNFQRNVGNYPGLMKTFSGSLDALDKGIKAATGDLGKMKNGFDAIAVNPVFTIIGLATALFGKLGKAIGEDAEGSALLNRAMKDLEPIMDFFRAVLDKVVEILADVIEKVSVFVQSNGLIPKIINGVVGVGNAILKFVIAPFKGIVAAIKTIQEEGLKGLRNAAKAYADEIKNGLAFKSNFEAGGAIVDGITSGMKKNKSKATSAAKEIAKESAESWEKEWARVFAKGEAVAEARRKAREAELKEEEDFNAKMLEMQQEELDGLLALADEELENYVKVKRSEREESEKTKEQQIADYFAVAGAAQSVLSSLADIIEANAGDNEKAAKRVKGIRIAEATINTINGAITAFMANAQNPIRAAAQAAAVTAAGVAEIAKIRNTQIGSSGSVASPSAPAVTSAPYLQMNIPQVRNVTSASEDVRLDKMSQDQRVVLVMSDLEVKQNQVQVQVAEASF